MVSVHEVADAVEREGPISLLTRTAYESVLNKVLLPVSPDIALDTADIWRTCRHRVQQYQHLRNPKKYTDADPLKTVTVSPERIELRYNHSGSSRLPRSRYSGYYGKVYSGDWDRNTVPIEERSIYVSMRDVYEEGADWETTEQYRKWTERHSQDEALRRCHRADQLLESLDKYGYIPQRVLVQNSSTRFPLREPVVNIGRAGELIHFRDGNHRLCAAKVIGVDSITVRIGARHAEWQAVRNRLRNAESTPAEVDTSHPDLGDLLPCGALSHDET